MLRNRLVWGLCVCWVISCKFVQRPQAGGRVCLCFVFGQRCLKGRHSLFRQHYCPPSAPLPFSLPVSYFLLYWSAIFPRGGTLSLYVSKLCLQVIYNLCFFFFFFTAWCVCRCLAGGLCSPVINLFCRCPSALRLLFFFPPSYSPTLCCLLFLQHSTDITWTVVQTPTPH